MRSLIEDLVFIFIVCFIFILVCIVGIEYDKGLDKEALKKETYSECLVADYDKFQCYSMIYGDK